MNKKEQIISEKDVIIVMGSHRKKGNTSTWAKALKQELENQGIKATYVDVNDLTVKDCIDCDVCKNHWGTCVHKDDMQLFYKQLKEAKVVAFAAPVYFNGLPSKLKRIVDRLQMIFMCDFSHKRPYVTDLFLEHKMGIIFSNGGAPFYEDQFKGNELSLKLVFSNLRMPLSEHIQLSHTDKIPIDSHEEGHQSILRITEAIVTKIGGNQVE